MTQGRLKMAVIPFYGQTDKRTGKFLLRSCGTTKMASFVARSATKELGWDVTLVAPPPDACAPDEYMSLVAATPGCWIGHAYFEPRNDHQRLSFRPADWERLAGEADVVLTFHELLAFPLKGYLPRARVAQYTCIPSSLAWGWMEPLFRLSWAAADLNAVSCDPMRWHVAAEPGAPLPSVWPLGFDAGAFAGEAETKPRDVGVLFAPRASSTNYTRHREFVEAVRILRARGFRERVVFTDATHYLRQTGEADGIGAELFDSPQDQAAYADLLRRSRVAVALPSMFSIAIREAAYCGALPLVPADEYGADFLGGSWQHFVSATCDPESIAFSVERALALGPAEMNMYTSYAAHRARSATYQDAWPAVRQGLERLAGERP